MRFPRQTALIALAAIAIMLGVLPRTAPARVVSGDAFLCAEARRPRAPRGMPAFPTFHSRVGVSVVDRFTRPLPSERYTLDLEKAEAFCWPVRLDDEDILDPLQGLEIYEARTTRRKSAPPPPAPVSELVESPFGAMPLRVGRVDGLAVPTLATGSVGGGGPERDHVACHRVQAEPRRSVLRVEIRMAESRRTVEIRKPERLCVPASVRGNDPGAPKHPLDLLCFAARLARDEVRGTPRDELLSTRNEFGNEAMKVGPFRFLCVPAVRTDVALPTPTPFPTLTPPSKPTPTPTATPVPTPRLPTLRLAPASATTLVRDRVCFAAYLELPDGGAVDVTTTALWRIADGTIAVPSGFLDGKKCVVGVGIGTTALTVSGAGGGAVSPPASFTAEWPIFKLTVDPKQLGLRPGADDTLTVTAAFTGNRTRNVTQHVRYESSDPAVVRAPNASGNRSRIEAAGVGTANVVVSDPFSSLSDVTAVAVSELRAVTLEQSPLLFPGESTSLTATGTFDLGFTTNLTQTASYESSDPRIVVATNRPGDRSRIEGVSPGIAVIAAVDPLSGIRSTCCGTVSVLGDLLDLAVVPFNLASRLGVGGDALALKARGNFAIPPLGSGARTVSDRVVWAASAPGVVAFAGVDADLREQLTAIGGGQVQVTATDPASGIVSPPTTVTIFAHLDRIEIGTSRDDPTELDERTILVGGFTRYWAHGYFDGGRPRRLDAALWSASEPGIVAFDDGFVVGLRPGTVTISALDGPSGVSSLDVGGRSATVQVFGEIEQLVLSPPTLTMEVGVTRYLTAVAHHAGGGSEPVTQRVEYASGDPSVVEVANDFGNRSRVVAKATGTATISARDPLTGITSTMSGDDTVITVVDDPLARIAVLPPMRRVAVSSTVHCTAIGTLASGATQNFTQRVEWIVSDPAVAAAPNAYADRSRIAALAPGTAMIAARDPNSGVLSTDSGDDATLVVEALTALTLTPATVELTVGSVLSLTTVGAVAGDDPLNITQDAVYVSSDPSVVQATNAAGNASRIAAIAPGVATITAFRASSYPQATESNAITVTVLPAP